MVFCNYSGSTASIRKVCYSFFQKLVNKNWVVNVVSWSLSVQPLPVWRLNKSDSMWMTASHLRRSGVVNMSYYQFYDLHPALNSLLRYLSPSHREAHSCRIYFGHQ